MPEPFKNLINSEVVSDIGEMVQTALPEFPRKRFEETCNELLDTLELKARAQHIGEQLWLCLPGTSSQKFKLLKRAVAAQEELPDETTHNSWVYFPFNSLLSQHGPEATSAAITLLPEVTKRFTAEFGIRSLIISEPGKLLKVLKKWAKDPNLHVRRLVSEGTRPRLPWGEQIPAFISDPGPILPLLELLKDDPELYVRRSVANNLNDISKDHPTLMLDTVEAWLANAPKERMQLIRHACRTLVKQGHPRCLSILGYEKPKLEVNTFNVSPDSIQLGERLTVRSNISTRHRSVQNLIIDFRFHFIKANGSSSPKVFKGQIKSLSAKGTLEVERTFHLKPVTTRRYYSGQTKVDLMVNGQVLGTTFFHLEA